MGMCVGNGEIKYKKISLPFTQISGTCTNMLIILKKCNKNKKEKVYMLKLSFDLGLKILSL